MRSRMGRRAAALHSDAERWSYEQLLAQANRIANVLVHDYGLMPGNRLLLRGPTRRCLRAWLACLRAGESPSRRCRCCGRRTPRDCGQGPYRSRDL